MSDETRDVEALAEVIDREVYCTVVIRPEHAADCQGDCPERGCPVPVQDYGSVPELAAAILASDWLAEHDARVRAEERERVALAIEDEADRRHVEIWTDSARWCRHPSGDDCHHRHDDGCGSCGYMGAARIAREGGDHG